MAAFAVVIIAKSTTKKSTVLHTLQAVEIINFVFCDKVIFLTSFFILNKKTAPKPFWGPMVKIR